MPPIWSETDRISILELCWGWCIYKINFDPATCFFWKTTARWSRWFLSFHVFSQHFSTSPGCGGYSCHPETERVGRLGWFHGQWLQWPQRSPATRGIWEGTIGELSSMMQDGWNYGGILVRKHEDRYPCLSLFSCIVLGFCMIGSFPNRRNNSSPREGWGMVGLC